MFKTLLRAMAIVACTTGTNYAQTDSTDLNLYFSEVVMETSMDSMLYDGGDFEYLELDFTISDTLGFNSVCVELYNETTGELLLRKMYDMPALMTETLISAWNVNLPFGNLSNMDTYRVALIVEDYTGALGESIEKTLAP